MQWADYEESETGHRGRVMRLLSKEGVAVIPGDRMDATGEEWVGETGIKNDLCLAGSGP